MTGVRPPQETAHEDDQDIVDWTGLGINEVALLAQDRIAWRQCVHRVADRLTVDGI